MGINDCRFLYVAVAAPGGVSDVRAYSKLKLKQLVERLPTGYYIIGDNAYVPTEHLITPFSGSQRDDPANDAYNFYLSQIRIKIEMAFGHMTTKWRILRAPLEVKLKTGTMVVMSIARLHNFVISERPSAVLESIDPIFTHRDGDRSVLGYIPSDTIVQTVPGTSMIRERIVRFVSENALARPNYNLLRNS